MDVMICIILTTTWTKSYPPTPLYNDKACEGVLLCVSGQNGKRMHSVWIWLMPYYMSTGHMFWKPSTERSGLSSMVPIPYYNPFLWPAGPCLVSERSVSKIMKKLCFFSLFTAKNQDLDRKTSNLDARACGQNWVFGVSIVELCGEVRTCVVRNELWCCSNSELPDGTVAPVNIYLYRPKNRSCDPNKSTFIHMNKKIVRQSAKKTTLKPDTGRHDIKMWCKRLIFEAQRSLTAPHSCMFA